MTKTKKMLSGPEMCGSAIVGERWQLVIPKSARRGLNLKPGDTMMVMRNNHAIILLPKKAMQQFVRLLSKKLHL